MNRSFDILSHGLVALISALVGYLVGRVVGSREPPLMPARPLANGDQRDEIRTLVANGDRLGAIRRLRELTGASLTEASRAVQASEREDAGTRVGLLAPGEPPDDR